LNTKDHSPPKPLDDPELLVLRHVRPNGHDAPLATLTLPFDDRRKSRARVRLDNGRHAALLLPRGTILRDGDRVESDGGTQVRICAAPEEVSTGRSADAHVLMRACYHLGNRHVALQIGATFVRYQHDHVLDRLARELGLEVEVEYAPFEPEGGGYGRNHSHAHGHGDDDHGAHDHHGHDHDLHTHHDGHDHERSR
jgi:urease accessory protein